MSRILAAAQLHRHIDGGQDRGNRRAVHRAPGEGAVQIDHVQPAEAGIAPGPRLRRRVGGIDGGAVHFAALQPHAGAVLQVDRREQGECHGAAAPLRVL
jgi:hypothetical protein